MSEYDAFAAVYDDWVGPIGEDDVDFYVSLAAEEQGPVVELAVGNGRVAVPIAERTGRRQRIGVHVLKCRERPARAERGGDPVQHAAGRLERQAAERQA